MDFFEDDAGASRNPEPRSGGGRRGVGPPDSQQQILMRRLVALGGGIVVLILLVLAVRGCLDARKERAFENYIRDLSSLTAASQQLSSEFFQRLEGGAEDESDLGFESAVQADRGTAQGLVGRARGLDAPNQLSEAQAGVVLSFELRREALATIADQLPLALADEQGANRAVRQIARQMEWLLASDVLYERARDRIEAVLAEEEIQVEEVPQSRFLPAGREAPNYTDQAVLESALRGAGAPTADPEGRVRGTGIASTTIGGITLEPGVPATIAAEAIEVEVVVHNQGEVDESDIPVSVTIEGSDSGGNARTPRIAAGEMETVTIQLRPAPQTGEALELTVEVDAVPGEEVLENNVATYTVTFDD